MKSILLTTAFFVSITPIAMALTPPPKPACNFEKWVGQDVTRIVPKVKKLDRKYRIVPLDGSMTDDYVPGRINIMLDEDGTVTDVYCEG